LHNPFYGDTDVDDDELEYDGNNVLLDFDDFEAVNL
jgi:hypothetical protein